MPKRGVGHQQHRFPAGYTCTLERRCSIVWRVVTAGTLDTIEQSVVCAAEYSVPSVAAPMCCPGSPGPGKCGVLAFWRPGSGAYFPFACLTRACGDPGGHELRPFATFFVAGALGRCPARRAAGTPGLALAVGRVAVAWCLAWCAPRGGPGRRSGSGQKSTPQVAATGSAHDCHLTVCAAALCYFSHFGFTPVTYYAITGCGPSAGTLRLSPCATHSHDT